ncbi:MAG: glycosyltransferase [Deltaproteobacteria bacterium]|nr:glycosyltransferase [Deltaproteobacteria bacterium]
MPTEFVSPDHFIRYAESAPSDSTVPIVEVHPSRKDGLPVPRFAGKTVHSLFDPREEARRFVDVSCQRAGVRPGETVATVGNGFGYVAEALLEKGFRPVAFEPCRELFGAMAKARDVREFLRSVELYLIDDPADLHRSGRHREALGEIKAFLPLPYVSWLCPEFSAKLAKKAAGVRASRNAFYRVSVVSPLAGGSWEIARYAANGLLGNGFPVDFIDVSGFGGVNDALQKFHAGSDPSFFSSGQAAFAMWCSDRIMERVNRFDPGIVLVLAQAPLSPVHVREMRDAGRRVVYWFVEDYHLFRYWENDAANYDAFFPIQKGAFLRDLSMSGQRNAHCLPLAADETVFHPRALSGKDKERFGSPLSFMGAGYYNRRRFFNLLASRPFKIWGTGWNKREPLFRHVQEEGRRVDSFDTAKIYNGTEVNINLHSSTSHEGVNPFGDFVNPRTFEIAACSAFQLVDSRQLLPELFTLEDEVTCFTGRDDFLDKVDYYLSHPEERAEMAARAMARVLREHTYRDRMREIVEVIHEICPPEAGRRLPTVEEMSREGAGPEWKKILAEFPADRPLSFDALLADVQEKRAGQRITRKEAMVLLLGKLRHGAI